MNRQKTILKYLIPVLVLWLSIDMAAGSTIGIATGNTTVDGRPLLFKTKDRKDNYPSDVDVYPGSSQHLAYAFQENFGEDHLRARMGINQAGFAVVYTTSENLQGSGSGPNGAELAAMALKSCTTISDFRTLLNRTAGLRDVHEHYAVIDSCGCGSLFEVDGYSHVEIPVRDSIAAMANTARYHPSAGPPAAGSTSPRREARVVWLLTHGPDKGLDYTYFLNEVMKDFCTTQADEDAMPVGQYLTNAVISRYKTAAACVIRGCKTGDNPATEGIMWLVPGEPSFSLAVPLFADMDSLFSGIRAASAGDGLAGSIDRMRSLLYDYGGGRYSDKYIDTNRLVAIRRAVEPVQNDLSAAFDRQLPGWRQLEPDQSRLQRQHWAREMQARAKHKYDSLYTVFSATGIRPDTSLRKSGSGQLNIFPNPLRQSARIQLPVRDYSGGPVTITLVSPDGRHTHLKGRNTGQEIVWDGRDTNGRQMASGIYFIRVQAGLHRYTRKIIILH